MKNNQQVIGLIGGMGPFAGAEFCRLLLAKSAQNFGAKNGDEFPEIVLDSIPVPDFISNTKTLSEAKTMLISRINKLNKFGCTSIAMVCNTGHILFPTLSKVSEARMISLIDAVRDRVALLKFKRVGILATKTSLESNLFQDSLAKIGIKAIKPDEITIDISEKVIRGVIANHVSKQSITNLVNRTRMFVKKESLDGIILGCTELPLAFPKNKIDNVIDCLDVLSDKLLEDFFESI